jgi:signal transduction histidine kinase
VLAVAAVSLPLAAVILTGLVMLKGHDALVLGVVAAASAVAAGVIAVACAAGIARRVGRLRDAAGRLAAGDLAARVERIDGPAELRQLASAFNEMASALDRLLETRRNLIAWASHDLRAPLASLQAMIEALEDGVGRPEDYLPEMRRQVRTLAGLVDDIFELSRIELDALALELIDVSVAHLAAGCVHSLKPQAEKQGIRLGLEVDGSPTKARARCAPDKVQRVLMNLLTNALRHTPHDGSVAVRVRADGPAVTVAVEDTGDGIPEGARERVFESFWRADRSRSGATGGAGLGLAIARGLVEAQGGRIWAENRPEGGARFVFTLPAA